MLINPIDLCTERGWFVWGNGIWFIHTGIAYAIYRICIIEIACALSGCWIVILIKKQIWFKLGFRLCDSLLKFASDEVQRGSSIRMTRWRKQRFSLFEFDETVTGIRGSRCVCWGCRERALTITTALYSNEPNELRQFVRFVFHFNCGLECQRIIFRINFDEIVDSNGVIDLCHRSAVGQNG